MECGQDVRQRRERANVELKCDELSARYSRNITKLYNTERKGKVSRQGNNYSYIIISLERYSSLFV